MNLLFLKALFKNKKMSIIYFIFIIIINTLLLLIMGYEIYINNKIININNRRENREIYFKSEQKIPNLIEKKASQINLYFEPFYAMVNAKYNMKIHANIKSDIPPIIYGRSINNYYDEVLIPDRIRIKNKWESTKKFLGKSVDIYINETFHSFKVVGIFKSNEINSLYISDYSIKKYNLSNNDEWVITVKKNTNTNKVIDILSKKDNVAHMYNESAQNEMKTYNNINKYIKIGFSIFSILNVIIIFLIYYDLTKINEDRIILLKAFGYQSEKVLLNLVVYIVFLFVAACITSSIIYIPIFKKYLVISNLLKSYLIIFLLNIVITAIILLIYYFKIKKLSIISLLNDTES